MEASMVGAGKVVSEREFVRRMSEDVQGREVARLQLYESLATAPANVPHTAVVGRRRSSSAGGSPSPTPSPTASPAPRPASAAPATVSPTPRAAVPPIPEAADAADS
eukprot:tig00020510_g9899.t1